MARARPLMQKYYANKQKNYQGFIQDFNFVGKNLNQLVDVEEGMRELAPLGGSEGMFTQSVF